MSQPAIRVAVLQQAPDFCLVMGGPLFQLFRKAHLSGDHLQRLYRRRSRDRRAASSPGAIVFDIEPYRTRIDDGDLASKSSMVQLMQLFTMMDTGPREIRYPLVEGL